MSFKTMNRIRKFISNNLCEDEMDVDLDFTERYLSQFESIDRQTIEVLIENGYQTKEHLLAFDLRDDLPLLPVLNMAQKSLLRKALKQFQESEELEIKIHDLKGDDSPNVSFIGSVSPVAKRKRDSGVQPSTKKLRSDSEKAVISSDGLGTRMRQLVNKRKPIRSSNSQTDSDTEPEFFTTVDPKRFQFGDNQMNSFGHNSNNSSTNAVKDYDEEEEEFQVFESLGKRLRGCPRVVTNATPAAPLRGFPLRVLPSSYSPDEDSAQVKQEVVETKQSRGRRSHIPLPSPSPARREVPSRASRKSIGTPYLELIKSESKTTPKTGKPSSESPHIPTPTELEVRERLAQKKALAEQKSGRRRR